MPIDVDDAKKYEEYEEMEIRIYDFLERNRGKAFTYDEIYSGLGMSTMELEPNEEGSNWTMANAGKLVGNVLILNAFHNRLTKMAASGKIKMRVVKGEDYYFIE